ncbi:hypothetical protein [Roseateles sp. YR242]|uniref:hypothetical protein n=1 Tax=Roseateles sp. YR242 TaxID=1855305 RepID=UPI0015A52116|nr:hypothetical protein [Roseateles sp. YR242]
MQSIEAPDDPFGQRDSERHACTRLNLKRRAQDLIRERMAAKIIRAAQCVVPRKL